MGTRRIFVGDLQGCAEEFERLLERVGYDPAGDRLLPLGDLVNRGPDSLRCLRLCFELGAETVLGNHDLHLLRCAAGTRQHAPGDTLEQVLEAPDAADLLTWLRAQPFLRVHPDLYQVHAGLHPDWTDPAAELAGLDPVERDPRSAFCTRVRRCDPAGRQPPGKLDDEAAAHAGFEPWDTHYDPGAHAARRVVFGHWAQRGRFENAHAIGLDSGCVWGGELSAWIPEEQRVVSVPAARVYRQPS